MAATRRAKPAAPDPEPQPEPATERAIANLERDLRTVTRRKARAEAADEAAAAERDRVIRDAIAAGITYPRIAELTDLSLPRLHQIRRGTRL